jgi:hypothetical protein
MQPIDGKHVLCGRTEVKRRPEKVPWPLAEGSKITIASRLQQLRRSLINSAGTIVFGMEDGTVSIFGLIFGVAPPPPRTARQYSSPARRAQRPPPFP